jgi:hypothetical protein
MLNRLRKYRQQLIEAKTLLQDIKGLKNTINQIQSEIDHIHDTKACLEIRSLLEKHLAKHETKSDSTQRSIDRKFIGTVIYQYGADIKSLQTEMALLKQNYAMNNEIFSEKSLIQNNKDQKPANLKDTDEK